jgi:hypothetical protein
MAYKALVTNPQDGSAGYNAETQTVSLDYNYSVIDGVAYGWSVKVYFDYNANPSQIQQAVKDAIIADVYIRTEGTDILGQNDVKFL